MSKTTITLALATICYLATSFNAQAQKQKIYKEAAKTVTEINKPYTEISAVDAIFKTPKQDKNLGQLTGIIKNETSYVLDFGNIENKYNLNLKECKYEKKVSGSGDVQLVDEGYFYVRELYVKQTNYVFEKINEKEYKYTIYNIPLNTNFVISVMYNYSSGGCTSCPNEPEKILNSVVYENAYKMAGIISVTLKNPIIISTGGNIITQNITIKNPPVVN
jgi:hypothetical protein